MLHYQEMIMRFSCDRVKLAQAVSNVSKAVSQKNAIQSLEGVLVVAKHNKLYLCGYDLEFSIKTQIDAVVNEHYLYNKEQNAMLGRRNKNKFVYGDKVTVEVDEKCLVIITGSSTMFTILGIPALDFPEVPTVKEDDCVNVSSVVLKNMIDRNTKNFIYYFAFKSKYH